MRRALTGGAVAALLLLASCGDDDDATEDTLSELPSVSENPQTAGPTVNSVPVGTGAPGTPVAGDAAKTVTVLAADYAFGQLPPIVQPGTQFVLQNDSTAEVHEIVAIRIPDEEARPVAELVMLPEEELDAIFGTAEPAFVIVAAPGEQGTAVVGDGTVTEEGRYAVVCFIPVGADPAEFMAAMQQPPSTDPNATEGPPDVAGGPPHVTEGMYGEFVVQEP